MYTQLLVVIFFFLRCRVVVDNVGDHVMPEHSVFCLSFGSYSHAQPYSSWLLKRNVIKCQWNCQIMKDIFVQQST